MPARNSYLPTTQQGIGDMLTAFVTNIPGALATKYNVTDDEVHSVTQTQMVWGWFDDALAIARAWSVSLTANRDALSTGAQGTFDPMPGSPTLPDVPTLPPAKGPVQIEHSFFTAFSALVSRIKRDPHYDVADGVLLGIEGTAQPKPLPSVVPLPTVALVTAGHPEVTCTKGVYQGFKVFFTRPGQAQKDLGMSLGRHFEVTEPLPAAGTAEIWSFVVQYVYQNAPFGQMSAPVSITVRG